MCRKSAKAEAGADRLDAVDQDAFVVGRDDAQRRRGGVRVGVGAVGLRIDEMRRDDQVVVHRVLPEIADVVGEPAALGADRCLLPRLGIVDIGDQHVVLRRRACAARRRHEVLHDEFEIFALADQLFLVAVLVPGHRAPHAALVDEGEDVLQVRRGGAGRRIRRCAARSRASADAWRHCRSSRCRPRRRGRRSSASRYCLPVRSTPILPGWPPVVCPDLRQCIPTFALRICDKMRASFRPRCASLRPRCGVNYKPIDMTTIPTDYSEPDLHHLQVLDVLLREHSLTRAARELERHAAGAEQDAGAPAPLFRRSAVRARRPAHGADAQGAAAAGAGARDPGADAVAAQRARAVRSARHRTAPSISAWSMPA